MMTPAEQVNVFLSIIQDYQKEKNRLLDSIEMIKNEKRDFCFENEQLYKQVSDLEDKNEVLEDKNIELEERVTSLMKENNSLIAELEITQQELEASENDNYRLETELVELQNRNSIKKLKEEK